MNNSNQINKPSDTSGERQEQLSNTRNEDRRMRHAESVLHNDGHASRRAAPFHALGYTEEDWVLLAADGQCENASLCLLN